MFFKNRRKLSLCQRQLAAKCKMADVVHVECDIQKKKSHTTTNRKVHNCQVSGELWKQVCFILQLGVKKCCLLQLSRPTLFFCADPKPIFGVRRRF